jgi:hypothetical protein
MTVLSLQDLCIDYIVKKVDNDYILKNNIIDYHFEERIFFIQHKKKMSCILRYIEFVNNDINNNYNNVSILSIQYLVSQDFFSYNYLLVTFCTKLSVLVNINKKVKRQYVRHHSFIKI